jgi:hypothetical protein
MSRDEFEPTRHEAHVHSGDIEYASERTARRQAPALIRVTATYYVLAPTDGHAERMLTDSRRRPHPSRVESEQITCVGDVELTELDKPLAFDGRLHVSLRTAAEIAGLADGEREWE